MTGHYEVRAIDSEFTNLNTHDFRESFEFVNIIKRWRKELLQNLYVSTNLLRLRPPSEHFCINRIRRGEIVIHKIYHDLCNPHPVSDYELQDMLYKYDISQLRVIARGCYLKGWKDLDKIVLVDFLVRHRFVFSDKFFSSFDSYVKNSEAILREWVRNNKARDIIKCFKNFVLVGSDSHPKAAFRKMFFDLGLDSPRKRVERDFKYYVSIVAKQRLYR